MTSEEALQAFIDSRLPRDKQELYPTIVANYRAAWAACERFRDEKFNATIDTVYRR